jgi:biopolymer transport protein ExbB
MKRYIPISLLLFSTLCADEPFVMTNQPTTQENVDVLTTTDSEYETLFEVVDFSEPAALAQNEELILSNIEAPLIAAQEVEPATAEMIGTPETAEEIAVVATPVSPPAIMREPLPSISINFSQVFSGSPIIYSLLLTLSMVALFIGLYSQIHLHNLAKLSEGLVKTLRHRLTSNQYDEALAICIEEDNLFCKMLASGISVRKYGLQQMSETMKSEGKRATVKFWQKLSLLNDIAIIAPMIGLLGTVLGMFYAFYDVNRSLASISSLFDGLGISVGTTLAGLSVAIFALILHSLARYRLVKRLAYVERETEIFATLIDTKI